MSPLRVYTYTNIKHYPCFVQLHILSFYRIEVKSCHLYVYIHTITSNVAPISKQRQTNYVTSTCIFIQYHQPVLVFCATSYSAILQNRGRQVTSHLRVYTCTNVKRCPYFAELYRLSTENSIPGPPLVPLVQYSSMLRSGVLSNTIDGLHSREGSTEADVVSPLIVDQLQTNCTANWDQLVSQIFGQFW